MRIDYSNALLPNPPNSIIVTGGTSTSCYNTIVGGGGEGLSMSGEETPSFSDIESIETTFDNENSQWQVEYMLQSQHYEIESNFVQTNNTFIPQLIEFENYFSNGNFEAATEVFHQLTPNHIFEKNFKEVYDVALGYRTEEIRDLYDDEIERLVAIASQNPIDGGPAVFSARAILKFKENLSFTDKYAEPADNINYESYKTDEIISSDNALAGIKVYPNPADDELFIEALTDELYFVTINNAFGQKILSQSFNSIGKINTSQLTSGMYFMEVINKISNETFFEKFNIK